MWRCEVGTLLPYHLNCRQIWAPVLSTQVKMGASMQNQNTYKTKLKFLNDLPLTHVIEQQF